MKKYSNRTLSDTIGTIGSMLLFVLFAGCMLMIIAVAANTYSRISTNFDKTFGATAALRYVSNKINSAEQTEIIENGSGLILKSGKVVNIIYFRSGELYEKSIPADEKPVIEGGEPIFKLYDLDIAEEDNHYKITVSAENETLETIIRRR